MADLTRKTANLLNYKEITTTPNYATVTLITNGVNLTGKYMATIDISLEVGSTYKMSWLQEVVSGTADTGWRYKYTDNTYSNYGGNGGGITVEKDVSQVLLYVTKSNNTASVNYTNIMLSKGSTAKPYEPYGWVHSLRKLTTATEAVENPLYSDGTAITSYTIKGNTVQNGTPTPASPVDVNGVGERTANLFDKDRTQGIITNAYVNQSGEQVSSQSYYISYPIDVIVGGAYTWSFVSMTGAYHTSPTVAFYNDNNEMIGVASHNPSIAHFTFTVPNNTKYLRASVYVGFSQNTNMLLEGSTTTPDGTPLDYIPYGYEISILKDSSPLTPIYQNEPLMKIGNISDEVNSDGTVTRRIGKIDLGTLNWHLSSSYNGLCDSTVPNMRIISNTALGNAICTSFVEVNADSVKSTSYGFSSCLNSQAKPYINHTGFEGYTDEQFIEALSGVIMYYVLATPTTESVTAPSIPTADGANSITVDTTVQPSEFSATWTGWHDSSVKEYDGTDWQ